MAVLDNTFGAFLIGVVISATLYGVTCVQTWYYFTRYGSDPWYIKFMVAAVLLSDSVHQALITHTGEYGYICMDFKAEHEVIVYTYLVTDFGIVEDLGTLVWSLIVEVLFNGFTALMVQSFLTMRVYRLSNKSIVATASVLSLVIGEFVLVVIYVAKAINFTTFAQLTELKSLSMSVNALAAAGDVLIAVFLCTLLQQSRTGFRRSDTMISKLILFSINTGLLTSVCAVMSLISITVWPGTFIYIAFYFCLGRLYCNSLLATLNARKSLRGDSRDENMSLSLQGIQKSTASGIGTSQRRLPNNISIKIDTTQEYVRDEYSSANSDLKSAQAV
ncbi:hypothetical protein AZE42_05986 [Rhizopogon vesiculosus]|uniref:DUF6534 domain-containing protein n=1 Tax=Rhizopogon vesiculosus TaxID=180088 RepID=A0A1J8R5R8_9AGAM|nr:hypothetical protein AZE42_05986 [Rhizopogon vesiculosus]